MYKQVEFSYDNTLATPTGSQWNPINVTGYDFITVQITSANGWTGNISFWGGPGTVPGSANGLWGLNDAEDASSTSSVFNFPQAAPNTLGRNYRGSIAGLAVFGVWFADGLTYASATGDWTVQVGLYSSAK